MMDGAPYAFATSLVGSYPKPRYLLEGLTGSDVLSSSGRAFPILARRFGLRAFQALLDRAVDDVLDEQEELGLDLLTDGEQRRGHYLYDVVQHLGGVSDWSEPCAHGDRFAARLQVEGELRHVRPITVSSYRYARRGTSLPLKVTLPGPTTVADALERGPYRSARALAFAYADAIRSEVAALRKAGCTLVQLDDPGLLRDIQRAAGWGVEALERCVAGIEGLTTIVHLCQSSLRGDRPSERLLARRRSALFERLNESSIDQVSLEAKRTRLDPSHLRVLDRVVILGCLDVRSPRVETVDEIREQALRAAEHVPPGCLQLTSDCGMTLLQQDVARDKVAHLVKAARSLRA